MAQSKLKLDLRHKNKDGTYTIMVSVGHGTNLLISTGISVAENEWNGEKVVGKRAKLLNTAIENQLIRVRATMLDLSSTGRLESLSAKSLREILAGKNPKAASATLCEMFEKLIASKKSEGSASILRTALANVSRYKDPNKTNVADIDLKWVEGFAKSMEGQSQNSIRNNMQSLRSVMRLAVKEEMIEISPFKDYKIPAVKACKRSLPVEEIRKIFNANVDWGDKLYKDIFELSFCLIGINLWDLTNVTKITDGRIEYSRAKTHKPYSIKVEPEAMAIIERIRTGKAITPLYGQNRKTARSKVCLHLRRIGEQLGLENLSTYCARHSWATIAHKIGISTDIIAQALGHNMGNPMTAIYMDYDRTDVDLANRKVLDWVYYGKK